MAFAPISMRILSHSEQSDQMKLPAHMAGHPTDLPVNLRKTKGGATKSIYGKIQHWQEIEF
jgi:hypothetical protein